MALKADLQSRIAALQVGRDVPRREDLTLVRGKGVFVDDVAVDGLLHVAFLRSY